MDDKINEVEITVRFNEVDSLDIAHHSHYIIWFEVARFHFAEKVFKLTFDDFRKSGIYLPVVKVLCKYYESAKIGDKIIATVHCDNPNASMLNFFYEIFEKETMKRITAGMTTHIRTNTDGKVIQKFPHALQIKIDDSINKYPFCYIDSREARRREKTII